MKKFFRLCLSALVGGALACALLGSSASASPAKGKGKKGGGIYFIGNSYTYVNDLPAVVDGMLSAGKLKGKPHFTVDSYTKGAASLTQFLNDPVDAKCREKLEKGGFRWVVLQDQSQTPSEVPEMTMRGGRGWAEIAKKGGAKPVLFITWEHAIRSSDGKFVSTPRMQDKLTTTYCRLAKEINAKVAPVGEAWRLWREEHPETTLYSGDGSHPNPLGTYLAGCVFYAVFTGQSPVGLPHQVTRGGHNVLQVPAAQAKECQKIAWKVAKSFDPDKFLAALEEREAALPSVLEIRPILVPKVTMQTLSSKLGKPATVYKSGNQVFSHFLLREGAELQIICDKNGNPQHAMIIPKNAMSELIQLK